MDLNSLFFGGLPAVAAAALLTAPAAGAAPTCTQTDLATRQGYQCSRAPSAGVTPGHQCGPWVMRDWPFTVETRCRGSY